MERRETERRLASERIDVTLPGRKVRRGAAHPLNKVIREIEDIFIGMGYAIAEGPELEQDYYNFEALNLPKNHPARDMQDSFYITEDLLMRTHTSPVQVRTMERMKGEVPVKIICPGRVYRRDDDDATHSHVFTQIEGLVIDEHIRMSDLKGTLLQFAQEMFGKETQDSHASELLPVHRAECGGGCQLRDVRRRRVPGMQANGLAGDSRIRHGASPRAGDGWLRSRRSVADLHSAWV